MKHKTYITKSAAATKKLGEQIAKEVLKSPSQKMAKVLGLQGNLGGGKTTFLQGFAKGLKIKEKILSPTFVIQKRFKIKDSRFKNFYHFDCYRLKNEKVPKLAKGEPGSRSQSDLGNILELDFKKIISNPKNIVAIEWPERVKKVLPKNTTLIEFEFINKNPDGSAIEDPRKNRDKREINF